MSPGKLSSAFLIEMIRDSWPEKAQGFYQVNYRLDEDIYDNWINDWVTKVVCGARNRGKLETAIEKAKELGMTFLLLMLAELSPRKELWRPMEAEKILY